MSKFISELCLTLSDADTWRLDRALVYESDLVGTVVAPAGFETDLASVPRVPVIYAMWGDRAHREAVIHDYLFRIGADPDVSWSTANRVFLEAMAVRKVPFYIRWPMYMGVCIGSAWYFKRQPVFDAPGEASPVMRRP